MSIPDLVRVHTESADHFTCECGQWCLNSPCPNCEPEERIAYNREHFCMGCGLPQAQCSPSCSARLAGGWER